MYYYFTNSILAARDDDGGWVQLLVFLVIIIFSAISSLVKSRANKQKQSRPTLPRPRTQPPRPHRRPQPAAQRLHLGAHGHIPPPAPKPTPHPVPPHIGRPVVTEPAPEIQPQVELITPKEAPKQREPQKATPILAELEEADKLRRAIIYYEILGRPVSLRQPQDPIMGR